MGDTAVEVVMQKWDMSHSWEHATSHHWLMAGPIWHHMQVTEMTYSEEDFDP